MKSHLELDLYFLLLRESGSVMHFAGFWINTSIAHKMAMLKMIDIAYLRVV